jgi:hypothetical protein
MRFYFILLLAFFTIPVTAAPSSSTMTKVTTNTPDVAQELAAYTFYCPTPDKMYITHLTWKAPGGWTSTNPSFSTKITAFTGAHWNGVGIGRIVCTYQGNSSADFTILVGNAAFIKEPSGALWGRQVEGVKNCLSSAVTNCPFHAVVEDEGPTDLQDLEKLRQHYNPNNLSPPGVY